MRAAWIVGVLIAGCGAPEAASVSEPEAVSEADPAPGPASASGSASASAPAPASAPASASDPGPSVDWAAVAAAADAWTVETRGRSWDGGGAALALRRPVELPAPAACRPEAPEGTPVVRREPVTVGPSPPFPASAVVRVLRRDDAFLACTSCAGGTDVFELRVDPEGRVLHVAPRARTHGDAARTECLRSALAGVTFPASHRGPEVRLVVPVRVRIPPP